MRRHRYRRNPDGSVPPPPGYEACEWDMEDGQICGEHVRKGHMERHWGITHRFGRFDPVSAGRKGGKAKRKQ